MTHRKAHKTPKASHVHPLKVYLLFFFDKKGVVHKKFLPVEWATTGQFQEFTSASPFEEVNSLRSCQDLQKLKPLARQRGESYVVREVFGQKLNCNRIVFKELFNVLLLVS